MDARKVTRRSIGLVKADIIDRANRRHEKRMWSLPYSNKRTRWVPGICTICKEPYGFITHEHAKLHGFASPNEMAKSDIVCPQGLRIIYGEKGKQKDDKLE